MSRENLCADLEQLLTRALPQPEDYSKMAQIIVTYHQTLLQFAECETVVDPKGRRYPIGLLAKSSIETAKKIAAS